MKLKPSNKVAFTTHKFKTVLSNGFPFEHAVIVSKHDGEFGLIIYTPNEQKLSLGKRDFDRAVSLPNVDKTDYIVLYPDAIKELSFSRVVTKLRKFVRITHKDYLIQHVPEEAYVGIRESLLLSTSTRDYDNRELLPELNEIKDEKMETEKKEPKVEGLGLTNFSVTKHNDMTIKFFGTNSTKPFYENPIKEFIEEIPAVEHVCDKDSITFKSEKIGSIKILLSEIPKFIEFVGTEHFGKACEFSFFDAFIWCYNAIEVVPDIKQFYSSTDGGFFISSNLGVSFFMTNPNEVIQYNKDYQFEDGEMFVDWVGLGINIRMCGEESTLYRAPTLPNLVEVIGVLNQNLDKLNIDIPQNPIGVIKSKENTITFYHDRIETTTEGRNVGGRIYYDLLLREDDISHLHFLGEKLYFCNSLGNETVEFVANDKHQVNTIVKYFHAYLKIDLIVEDSEKGTTVGNSNNPEVSSSNSVGWGYGPKYQIGDHNDSLLQQLQNPQPGYYNTPHYQDVVINLAINHMGVTELYVGGRYVSLTWDDLRISRAWGHKDHKFIDLRTGRVLLDLSEHEDDFEAWLGIFRSKAIHLKDLNDKQIFVKCRAVQEFGDVCVIYVNAQYIFTSGRTSINVNAEDLLDVRISNGNISVKCKEGMSFAFPLKRK